MEINKELIGKLRSEYGDAFYLLDSKQFRENFSELKNAFQKIYSKFNIAYSYKTNYTPKLCKIVNELGGYAEVVSEMELELALKCGVVPNKIIWNGPIKNPICLEKYILQGVTVNVDSFQELERILSIANANPSIFCNVGLRCNFDVGDGVVSRFGFDVESREFGKALELISVADNVVFKNFQCHFAKRQIDFWPARAKKMLGLLDKVGIIPERVDIGGGLFGKMRDDLKAQFSSKIPTYDDYAKAVATQFAEYFKNKEDKPELIIEPGSALVGDCMKFVGTVETIKDVRGKKFASVLASQKNISMSGVNPPIDIIHFTDGKFYENIDFVGFTCIEGDVLYKGYSGNLAVNDAVVISNCGSYSLVMKPPFILPNFPVLDTSEGITELIKRKENFEDIFNTFVF